ncbi:MAG: translocation/assembly module TamB domain-containing protein [Paludibacteraceae bacterium]|nr:translocation/assembly module TamB domain-containing protein [Paludibacteraceae bacterium]
MCGVTGSLEEKTGADVSLSRIDWNFPNAFVINQLYVSDEEKDTLLYVERAKVTLNILPLFHKTISFRTIQVTEADARVKYLKDQKKYNYDFLVEAFSTPNDTASIDWGFDLESLAFTDCRMDFVADKSVVPVDSVFCPQHVSLNDINGALFIKESMFDNTQEFRLHRLHFKERSGLELSNLSALLTVADNEIRLEDFVTQTQNSQLYLPQALISHSNVRGEDIAKLADSKIDIVLDPSNIHLADFSPLVRSFRNSKDDVRLSGTISGTRHEMYLKSFLVDMGETMTLDAEVKATEIFDIDSLGIDANLKSITLTADDARRLGQLLVDRPIYLPPVADSLGLLKFSGFVYGKFKELYAEGLLFTDGGSISTDVVVKAEDNKYERFGIVGATTARDFDLTRLFGKESGLGKTAFELEVDIQKVEAEKFDMELEGRIDTLYFKDYLYQGISLAGKLNDRKYTGNFSLKDDNISCEFEGSIDMKHRDMPVMNFMANVKDANIDKLNWINSSEPITVSFDITTNSSGKTLDDLSGSVTLDNFLCTRGDKYLYLNLFTLNTEAMKNGKKKIHVISDYINGSVEGKYSFATLLDNIKRITYSYLPTLKEMDTKYVASNEPSPANDFKFNFTLENTEPINDIIELPIVVQQKSVVKGFINDSTGKFQLRFEAPLFVYNENIVEDALLLVENPHDELKVVCRSTYADPDKRRYPYYLSLNSSAKNDNLDLRLSFSNSEEVTYSGNLSMKTALRGYTKDGLSADISIIPSKVVIKDSVWSIGAGEIELRPKLLDVKRFEVENKYQKFHAKGRTTDLKNDSLRIWFTDLDVTHFSNILDNKFITFGGVGDGDFYLTKLFSNPTVEGRLGLFDAYLNNYPFGDLEAEFGYDAKSNTMIFGTNVVSAYETHEKSIIDGAVYFDEDSLFIDGRLRDIDMRFLRVYLDGVLSNNTGVLNTHVLALGHFNNIGLEGMGLVRDFDFNIDYTDVKYTFTDTVWMTQNSFRLDGIKIKDMEGNSGQLSALILHEGFLHWKYAVNVDTDNLLALNTTENDNDLFYGKAYVAGKVGVSGSGDELNLNLDVKTNKDSKFVVPLDGAKGVNDAGFITFKKSSKMTTQEMRRVRREKIQKIKQEEDETPLIVNLNADIDATPDAQVSLILDKKLGDVIRARGNGSLSFSYDGRDDLFKLFGQYQITKGDYLFTIQSVIARKFELLNGSTVRWNGDPTAANVDINAKYTLNAYVGDILAEDNVTTTMVNCLMDISGTISQPQVKFDLNMPNIDDDMMRKVRSVINTDEAMNRNVASLLAFGTFNIGDVGTSSSQNMSSMGFAALSSEISGLLSKINNDVNVGLNYRPYTEDQTSARTEFEVALSTGLLNDRLILNGNFGYREGMSSFDATNYSGGIADVDIEYKLSPNGRFRAKAFNRSSNSYLREFNSQTQGVGLLYRHDYDNAEELISTYISPFKKIFGKRRKNKEENEEDNKKE